MDRQAKRKPNWRLYAVVCGCVVAFQAQSMATATEAPSAALMAAQWFIVICGAAGVVGSLVMMARTGQLGAFFGGPPDRSA